MLNKKIANLSAGLLLLQSLCQPLALAQGKENLGLPEIPGVADSVPGVSGSAKPGATSTSSVNDAWPWMQNEPGAAKKESAATPSTPPSNSEKPAAEPKEKREPKAEVGSAQPKFEMEKPQAAIEAKPDHAGSLEKRTEEKRIEQKPAQASGKPTMLYGRIEELTAGAGAKFPVLKAMTAKLDPRGVGGLKGGAVDTIYSGSVVRSFPTTFEGVWGGKLQVYENQQDRLYYELDPEEAKQTAELLKPGLLGQVNLQFEQRGSVVNLEPAQIFFSVPMSESRYSGMMSSMGQGQTTNIPGFGNMPGGMGAMMKSFMSQMPYIFSVSLGNAAGTGVTGNAVSASILKNDIHQLSPKVVEQDLVTTESSTNAKTGRTRRGFAETVVRVTVYDSMRLYVQAASVDYNSDKRFLHKIVFNGYVTKGQTEQVNPMGSLSIPGMPGMSNPAGGANPFQGLPGGANPFQGLFGQ